MAEPLFEELAARRPAEPPPVAAPAKGWTAGLDNFVSQATAELSRLGTQGAMELASALFGGSGFVPYGPGQYTPAAEGYGLDARGMQPDATAALQASIFGTRDLAAERTPAEPPVADQVRPEPAPQEQARQEQSRGR